ncbi:MAG: MFS transporter [Streptosporangiaceae bacterium]
MAIRTAPYERSGFFAGRRRLVFIAILLTNFTVWLDVAKFGLLAPFWSKDLHLTPPQISGAVASYLLGYFPMLFLAGILADRLGAKRMLLICMSGVTVMSASMAFVTTYTEMWWRNLIFGIFFGFLWAPCNRLLAMWFPGSHGARATSIWMSSTLLAGVIAPAIALPIAHHASWQDAFLVVAALGIPCLILLWIVVADRPELARRISPAEIEAIRAGYAGETKTRLSFRELARSLAKPSVITMAIATGLATTPTWLTGPWVPYALITLDKVNPDTLAWVSPLITLIPVSYGLFNGWIVEHVFRGRTKPALALGPALGAVGFILGVALSSVYWVLWGVLMLAVGFLCDPLFWGTINSYWSGLVRPEATGTLNGLSAALQVAVGWYITDQSGTWLNVHAQGRAQLNTIWIVGACLFVAAIIPVLISKEVRIRRTPTAGAPSGLLTGESLRGSATT